MSGGMLKPSAHSRQQPEKCQIGIISDSHGQVKPLTDALTCLREKGCGTLYHLGDICDSLHPETADACVDMLRKFQVYGVKGNNDHTIVANHEGRESALIKAETVSYLKQLPLVIELKSSLLAHSLPFEKELGLACMVGAMTRDHARAVFRKLDDRILFRGHSHAPEITWQGRHDRVASEAIPPGKSIEINERRPCIVTCGALDHGLCMLWSPEDGLVTSLQI